MKHTETTKKKIRTNHPDVRGKLNPMFGKKHSQEARAKIASARRNSKWMYDPLTGTQKAIDKNNVDDYLKLGWRVGRLRYQKDPSFLLTY